MTNTSCLAAGALATLLLCMPACSDPESTCTEVTTECAPLYEPTFENVFTNTLQQRCGVAGSACHAREGAQAGLVFVDIDESYALLTGQVDGRVRVDPDALGCDILLSRLASPEPRFVMPPAAPLSDAELCSIVQWVAQGATR